MTSTLYKYVSSRMDHELPEYLAAAKNGGHPVEHLLAHRSDGCRVSECSDKVVALGLCMKHYQRQRRNGTPLLGAHEPKSNVEIAKELTALTGVKVSRSTVQRWTSGT